MLRHAVKGICECIQGTKYICRMMDGHRLKSFWDYDITFPFGISSNSLLSKRYNFNPSRESYFLSAVFRGEQNSSPLFVPPQQQMLKLAWLPGIVIHISSRQDISFLSDSLSGSEEAKPNGETDRAYVCRANQPQRECLGARTTTDKAKIGTLSWRERGTASQLTQTPYLSKSERPILID